MKFGDKLVKRVLHFDSPLKYNISLTNLLKKFVTLKLKFLTIKKPYIYLVDAS